MFDLEPGFDEVGVVPAGGMTRLTRHVTRERRWQICHIDDLPVGGDGDDGFWLIWQRGTHIDGVDVAAKGKWTTIEHFVEWFDHAKWVVIGYCMNFAVLPLRNLEAKFFL